MGVNVQLLAQSDSINSCLDSLGTVEVYSTPINKGGNVNFEFNSEFNKQVSMLLYSEDCELISTTHIEVFSDKGLALSTRSFEPGIYFLCLKLKTKNLVKKISVID